MNRKQKIIVSTSVFLVLFSGTASPEDYKIIRTNPDGTPVTIAGKDCGIGDVFSTDDIISWNDDIQNQAIVAVSLNHRGRLLKTSRELFRSKTSENMSIARFGELISKGAHDVYIMEMDENQIHIEHEDQLNVTYHLVYLRDTIQRISVQFSESELISYSMDNGPIKDARIIDGCIVLTPEMFEGIEEDVLGMQFFVETTGSNVLKRLFSLQLTLI